MPLQRLQEDYLRTKRNNGEEKIPTPSPIEMNDYLADNCNECEALKDSLISLTCPKHTWPKIMGMEV